jgi:hypothetical protein
VYLNESQQQPRGDTWFCANSVGGEGMLTKYYSAHLTGECKRQNSSLLETQCIFRNPLILYQFQPKQTQKNR